MLLGISRNCHELQPLFWKYLQGSNCPLWRGHRTITKTNIQYIRLQMSEIQVFLVIRSARERENVKTTWYKKAQRNGEEKDRSP